MAPEHNALRKTLDDNDDSPDIGDAEVPDGLSEFLRVAGPSPDFERRCEEAATLAWSVAVLRKRRVGRGGFTPAPLAAYLQELAEGLDIDVSAVLRWFHIQDPDTFSGVSGRSLARLGLEIALTARELSAMVGLSLFGRSTGALPRSIQRIGFSSMEQCEAALGKAEWDLIAARRWRALEKEIHDEYARIDSGSGEGLL